MDLPENMAVREWPQTSKNYKGSWAIAHDTNSTQNQVHHSSQEPESNLPFVSEVAAPDCGTEAVLSQSHGIPGTIYSHAFFCRKLTPEEQNYDVGNKSFSPPMGH